MSAANLDTKDLEGFEASYVRTREHCWVGALKTAHARLRELQKVGVSVAAVAPQPTAPVWQAPHKQMRRDWNEFIGRAKQDDKRLFYRNVNPWTSMIQTLQE